MGWSQDQVYIPMAVYNYILTVGSKGPFHLHMLVKFYLYSLRALPNTALSESILSPFFHTFLSECLCDILANLQEEKSLSLRASIKEMSAHLPP